MQQKSFYVLTTIFALLLKYDFRYIICKLLYGAEAVKTLLIIYQYQNGDMRNVNLNFSAIAVILNIEHYRG